MQALQFSAGGECVPEPAVSLIRFFCTHILHKIGVWRQNNGGLGLKLASPTWHDDLAAPNKAPAGFAGEFLWLNISAELLLDLWEQHQAFSIPQV